MKYGKIPDTLQSQLMNWVFLLQLHTHLPQDRLRALARGETLPDRTHGSALFTDISGFMPLTGALTRTLGARRGSEELTRQINAVYDALIAEVEKYGGSVISFAGDAITCWFDGDNGLRALTTALAMQSIIAVFPQEFKMKAVVSSGPARRFAVGDPEIQLIDTLAGATITRLAIAEQLADKGETLIDTATATALAEIISINEWRIAENQERFAVIKAMKSTSPPMALPSALTAQLCANSMPCSKPKTLALAVSSA